MTPLAALIGRQIAAAGPMTVADYMTLCLTHPTHGYYAAREPFGQAGDFVTAPEVSQMFGELIGLWAAAVWQQMGRPAPLRLIELGPGRGTLMADLLRAAGGVPGFADALDVHLVENSRRLRAVQAERLGRVAGWHDGLETVPAGPAVVVANEFFDALPVRQFVRTDAGWCERLVACDADGALRFAVAAGASPLASALPTAVRDGAPKGGVAELCPAGTAIVDRLGRRLAEDGGAALIIDYGHTASTVGDTLQAVRAHAYAPVLEAPGQADLTAHVDFAQLAAAARDSGARVWPPLTQSAFLQALGIGLRARELSRNATDSQAQAIAAGLERLIGPGQMGTLFKVLAVSSPNMESLPGFEPEPAWPNT